MKLRTAFISNSSSSSYLAVGCPYWGNPTKFKALLGAIEKSAGTGSEDLLASPKIEAPSHGVLCHTDTDLYIYFSRGKVQLIGVEAEQALEADKKLSEIKEGFQEKARELGVEIPLKEIRIVFGEASDEGG